MSVPLREISQSQRLLDTEGTAPMASLCPRNNGGDLQRMLTIALRGQRTGRGLLLELLSLSCRTAGGQPVSYLIGCQLPFRRTQRTAARPKTPERSQQARDERSDDEQRSNLQGNLPGQQRLTES